MAQVLNLKIAGLYTNPNQLSETPEGGLLQALNTVIDRGGIIESRRGHKKLVNVGQGIEQIYEYQDKLILHYGNKFAYQLDSNYNFQEYTGDYFGFDPLKIKSTLSNKNIYFATLSGVKKIAKIDQTQLSDSGVPKAYDGNGIAVAPAVGSGWLPNNKAVAYRLVWGFRDINNNLLLSAPSGRAVVTNTSGGTKNVSLTFQIPPGITTEYFYQIYRSSIVDHTIEPSDDLQLVYEGVPTSGQISAKEFTVTDITDPILGEVGAFLYTSPGQEGILQANEQPPLCKDLCTFKNMTFFANTKTKQRLFATLIATGSPSGFQIGDSITVNSETYTGVGSSPSANQFIVYTSSPDPSENIRNTAKAFIASINKNSSTIGAYYLSGYADLPGKILIEAINPSLPEFQFSCSRSGVFTPVNSTNTIKSSNDEFPNRVFYSKLQQPEAVPIINYLDCGSSNEAILRIIPLKDSVFVLKAYSIYRIIGEDPFSLRVSLFDNAINFYAPDTAVLVDSTIYCDTDQGLTSISDNGIQILSRPIENLITTVKQIEDFDATAFGVGYDYDRKYILFCKENPTDIEAVNQFVYNYFTNAWTKWHLHRTCGLVASKQNLLFTGDKSGYLWVERKNNNLSDYSDEDFDVTITAFSGNVITLASTANIVSGMVLEQFGQYSTILTVNTLDNQIIVSDNLIWVINSATVFQPIEIIVEWSQQSTENPGILKHFREITAFFRTIDFESIKIAFKTNFTNLEEEIEILNVSSNGWGEFTWGEIAWGSDSIDNKVIRTYIPRNCSRGHILYPILKSGKGRSRFSFQGFSLIFENMSERFKDGSTTGNETNY